MSKVLIEELSLNSIGAAIRSKNNVSTLYKPSEMAAAISAIDTSGVTPTGSISITQNGTVDVTQYASAAVAVPNSYTAGDEGKVVSNGTLVTQTVRSSQITENGTYDTTENNSVTVNVSGGSPTLITKNITQNGTYNASSDSADGYSQIVVNVHSSGGNDYESWDLTQSLTGEIREFSLTTSGITVNNTGAVFGTNTTGVIVLPFGFSGMTIEIDVTSMSLSGSGHKRFVMQSPASGAAGNGFIYRSNGRWSFYNGNGWATDSNISDTSFFSGSTVKVVIDVNGYWHIYKNDTLIYEPNLSLKVNGIHIGTYDQSINNTTISAIRIK